MCQISTEILDGIAVVKFGNPPKGLMNQQTIVELRELAETLAGNDAVSVVVFTGGLPGVFIRHYDVAELAEAGEQISRMAFSPDSGQGFPERDVDVAFQMIENLPQVTIAAINGYCMGGGYEFALCCDLRIAVSGDYRIGLPECRGGIFPGAGGTQRLPRVVGRARALDLILRGRLATPDEALEWGLVQELTDDDVLEHTMKIARAMAGRLPGPRGIVLAKKLVGNALDWPLAEGLGHERAAVAGLLADKAVSSFLAEAARNDVDILKLV